MSLTLFEKGPCCKWDEESDRLGYVAFGFFAVAFCATLAHALLKRVGAGAQYVTVLYGLGLAGYAIYVWDQRRKCDQGVHDALCIAQG